MSVENTALFRYLSRSSPQYRAKLLEVREEVGRWLEYVPQTFPHYTQHTVEHSEAIIGKLSRLLFPDDDSKRPQPHLSGIELYILAASSYLHDAGMVASDHEKEEILRSDEWLQWTGDGGGAADRWREISAMRSLEPRDPLRDFAVDRQVRFLIGEFVRRQHHRRAADVIAQHHFGLGRLDYGDAVLRSTISNVCVAHGLDRCELEDRERFPQRREIRRELVNVQFLAVLLRIGDLLDMRCDRACSLLLSAACPLPADSDAHWSQYQCIKHELVAPDRIELLAECLNQEEHRYIFDWCTWLYDEVRSGTIMMANASRHAGWRGPEISIGDGTRGETIVIRPARGARYIPRKWQFELDATTVFERLIRDLYGEPHAYVRELIQNALDAMRCQMYLDLRTDGLDCPEYPTDVPPDRLARYELRISLEAETVKNSRTGKEELCQVLVVDDCGIGMDQEVIEKFFLQVGRSYYTSDSFRRSFPFHPVSRFGVGFLSVFAQSDHVRVETLRTFGCAEAAPIALTLTGPRSYLLSERGTRTNPGTRIAVRLGKVMEPGQLTKLVSHWCRRVEFAVRVREFELEEVIVADGPHNWVCEMTDPADGDAKLAVRALPINVPGVRGELYVLARVTSEGESWAEGFPIYKRREEYPFASLPQELGSYVCQQGLFRGNDRSHRWNFGYKIDDRRRVEWDVLDHGQLRPERGTPYDVLEDAWWSAIIAHLASCGGASKPEGWRYVHRLAAGLPASWWALVPSSVPVWLAGYLSLRSVEYMAGLHGFSTICGMARLDSGLNWRSSLDTTSREEVASVEGPVLLAEDLERFDKQLCQPLFAGRRASDVRWLTPTALLLTWTKSDERPDTCEFYDSSIIGIRAPSRTNRGYDEGLLLNTNNPLVEWAAWALRQRVRGAQRFWKLLGDNLGKFSEVEQAIGQYLAASELERRPPEVKITQECFLFLREEPHRAHRRLNVGDLRSSPSVKTDPNA